MCINYNYIHCEIKEFYRFCEQHQYLINWNLLQGTHFYIKVFLWKTEFYSFTLTRVAR